MRHRPSPRRAVSLLLTLSLLAATAAVPVPVAGAPSTVRLVLTMRPGTSHSHADRLSNVPGGKLVARIDQLNVRVVEVPAAAVANARGRWARLAEVVSVESDGLVSADWIPPDPLWTNQWEQRQVRAQKAWDLQRGERTTIVAVVDTGVQLKHPDLAVRLVPGRDFVNNDATPADDNGHGTSVAGVIAATANSIGVTGMCNRCRIMPVKALAANGTGMWTVAAKGIIWAADHGADVINLSFGGPTGGRRPPERHPLRAQPGRGGGRRCRKLRHDRRVLPRRLPGSDQRGGLDAGRPALRLVELLDLLGRSVCTGLHLDLQVALAVRRLLRHQRGDADGVGHRGPGALRTPGHDALAGGVDPEGGHGRGAIPVHPLRSHRRIQGGLPGGQRQHPEQPGAPAIGSAAGSGGARSRCRPAIMPAIASTPPAPSCAAPACSTHSTTFAHTSKRSTIPGRSGFWYQLVDGALSGYWVAESSKVFLTPTATPTPTPAPTP